MNLEKTTRRRGDELENAILDAAWTQLVDGGYAGFTYEKIAARAGTSRPVLYRRWAKREDLLVAAVRKFWFSKPIEAPDNGSLREDMIGFLRNANAGRSGITTILSVQLMEYFRDTGTSLRDLRDLLRGPRRTSGADDIVARAIQRGDLPNEAMPERVITLPFDLLRHELFMTMQSVPEQTIVQVIDDIWLPLLRSYGATV